LPEVIVDDILITEDKESEDNHIVVENSDDFWE